MQNAVFKLMAKHEGLILNVEIIYPGVPDFTVTWPMVVGATLSLPLMGFKPPQSLDPRLTHPPATSHQPSGGKKCR